MTAFRAALVLACLLAVGELCAGDREPGALSRLLLPDAALGEDRAGLQRDRRSPEGIEDDDGPEGRHLHKIKRKLKPHKFGHYHGGLFGSPYPAFGGYPGFGGCRTLHGCGGHGGGWHKPHYGGGPIAAAFAGPSPPAYGGWSPGFGYRPNAHSQVATWNLGPFQASFGLAQAG